MMPSRRRLIEEIEAVVRGLEKQTNGDVDPVLDHLVAVVVRTVPGVQHAGITLASSNGEVRTASTTGPYPMLLDKIQAMHHEGPCLSAAWDEHVMRINDMVCETRWPAYSREALEQTPIRSVVSFELLTESTRAAALNFYAERPEAFDDDAIETGRIYASHTALVWTLLRRDQQFRSALASRDIIGQAKGMVMERFNIDAVQAFELLKRLSQSSNTALASIALQLVESERANRRTTALNNVR